MFGSQRVIEVTATVFEQIQHKFESVGPVIVGVGHMVVARRQVDECRHRNDFLFILDSGSHHPEVACVRSVHGDYEVEIVEVAHSDLSAYVVELIATAASVNPHPLVGEIPDVVVTRSGRIDDEPVGVAAMLHQSVHHPVGGRRAADVAQAYKQYANFLLVFQ